MFKKAVKLKRSLGLGTSLCLVAVLAWGQEREISGQVTDEAGNPLGGVTVLIKDLAKGTVTDIQGIYKLEVPGNGSFLVFSFVGFEPREIAVADRAEINVSLVVRELQEVVITALNISRAKASLGYGVTSVSKDLIQDRSEPDIARILRGKVPGVEVLQTSGLAGSGTNIIIRGYSSITGNNQPLFVVDGSPVNSSTNPDRNFVEGGATASSRFLDLDPNNIAEISVLKGLSATTLYGEEGKNGVVLIKTKTSELSNEDVQVEFFQQFTLSEIANMPSYQNTYGIGFGNEFLWRHSNWGPAFSTSESLGIGPKGVVVTLPDGTQETYDYPSGTTIHPYDQPQYHEHFPEFIGRPYEYRPYRSVENFYQTGVSTNTSIALQKRIGHAESLSLIYSNYNDVGIIPADKNTMQRDNLSLGVRANLRERLSLNTTLNYANTRKLSPPAAAGAGSNPSGASLFANLIYTPRSVGLLELPFQSPVDGSMVYYRRPGGNLIQNPLWTLQNASDTENINRIFGQISLTMGLAKGLNVTYRIGLDQFSHQQRRSINKGGSQIPNGEITTSALTHTVIDQLLNFEFDLSLDNQISVNGLAGLNLNGEERERTITASTDQFVFDLFKHDNFREHQSYSLQYEENLAGAFFQGTIGFREYLYLNLTGRNDWTSTLERRHRSNFYPGISLSFLPSDAFPILQGDWLGYLKFRAGYGTSAGYPRPYQTRNILSTSPKVFITRDGQIVDTNSVSDRLGNPNLSAESSEEYELGLESKFFRNRLGIEFALYQRDTKDLILDLALNPATGFRNTTSNAGHIQNRGLELATLVVPVDGKLRWDLRANFTKNESMVISILDGIDQLLIQEIRTNDGITNIGSTSFDGVGNYAIPGHPFGVIQGTGWERVGADRLVNEVGFYEITDEIYVIGDPNPDLLLDISSRLTWKGLSFYMLWSYTSGGDIYSVSATTLLARGMTVETDVDRFVPIVVPGVRQVGEKILEKNGFPIKYSLLGKNDFQVDQSRYFFWNLAANEASIYDGTAVRWREASLSYNLPQKILGKTPFRSIAVDLRGQNLWHKAFNFPKGVNYDPDVLSTGVGNHRGMEFVTGPTVRRYSFSIKITL